jgi:hypothetical protein
MRAISLLDLESMVEDLDKDAMSIFEARLIYRERRRGWKEKGKEDVMPNRSWCTLDCASGLTL